MKDVRCENITVKRDIDNGMAYGTMFAKRCKSSDEFLSDIC